MSSIKTPNPANEHLLPHDDSSDWIGNAKPLPVSDEREIGERHPPGTVPEQPLRRYWVRPLVLIFIPPIVTAYYGVIWVYLLQNSPYDEIVKYRTFSGSLIFYSWFIIGVFGLSWSKFGLVGVEASMLRSRFWGPSNLVTLLMHSNGTWSSPSGWINAIVHREFHRLWCLLTFLSLLPFIALPLSGLVFEISDGYIRMSDAPSVIGRNISTFNERYDSIALDQSQFSTIKAPAQSQWLIGSAPTIPGIGVVFTGESVNRSNHSVFKNLPNRLPLTESIPDLFLAPQADKPVSGKAWGLRFKYDCSIVRSASEFTLLVQKSASSINDDSWCKDCLELRTPSGDAIFLWDTISNIDSTGLNTHAYFEIGTSGPLEDKRAPKDGDDKYDGNHPHFEVDEGDTSLVFEYAAWQLHVAGLYDDGRLPFNATLEPSIDGLGTPFVKADDGTYALNKTFFAIKGGKNKTTDVSDLMELESFIRGSSIGDLLYAGPPIGVRCVAPSDVGTAEVDGLTSTFRDFQRSSPDFNQSFLGSLRFGRTAQHILNGQFQQHFISGDMPGTTPGLTEQSRRRGSFIDPESLLRSVNLAYALDASNLLYDITSGFGKEWLERGLTSSREGKILSVASLIPGAAVGYFVLALFCIWAALSAGLGLWYGFQRRPADRLDGYTMLRKGADMADELKENDEFMDGRPYHGSGTLPALPANVSNRKR